MTEKKHYTIPFFIPELACPFQCVFCDQKKISGRLNIPDIQQVISTIESHLATIPVQDSIIEAGFFGGNFTGIPFEQQRDYLQAVQPYIQQGLISAIRVSTRPDYITPENLGFLKTMHVQTIELGAQSLNDEVLKASGRGHLRKDIVAASRLINDMGFSLGLQMMTGLPKDTLERSLATAEEIISLGAENTRIYPTLIIRGTKLEHLYNQKKYSPLSLETAVQWSKEILKVFETGKVKVIRLGLHPSDGLLNGENLVAGPFHISFRELVLTGIWNDLLLPLMKIETNENITINVNPAEYNYAIGYEGKNKKMLGGIFRKVSFKNDDSLSGRNFRAYLN